MTKKPEIADYGLTDNKIHIISDVTQSTYSKRESRKNVPRIIAFLLAIGLIYVSVPILKHFGFLLIMVILGGSFLFYLYLTSTEFFESAIETHRAKKLSEHHITLEQYNEWSAAESRYRSDLYKYEKENKYKNKYNYYPKSRNQYPKHESKEKSSLEGKESSEVISNPFQNSWNDDLSKKYLEQKLDEISKKGDKPNVEVSNPFGTYFVKLNSLEAQENKRYVSTGKTSIEEFLIESARKSIGDEGELFVIEYEKKKLGYYGLNHLIEKIVHVSAKQGDSHGFDILSFNEHGKEILIEVKTTLGDIYSSFYITDNELRTRRNSNNYVIYRVHGFDRNAKTGKIFIIDSEMKLEEYFKSEAKVFKLTPSKFESKKIN